MKQVRVLSAVAIICVVAGVAIWMNISVHQPAIAKESTTPVQIPLVGEACDRLVRLYPKLVEGEDAGLTFARPLCLDPAAGDNLPARGTANLAAAQALAKVQK